MEQGTKGTSLLAARVSAEEREAIERLARSNDRSPSREVRRAVRYYIAHFEAVDEVLRKLAGSAS